jgi:hypothetical protein
LRVDHDDRDTDRKMETTTQTRLEQTAPDNGQNGKQYAPKNGRKREENGTTRKVGPGSPPQDRQFQSGNPGGPGRPKGARSMRKLIRKVLFDPQTDGKYAAAIVDALFNQAMNGNTHAIRMVLENGNSRRRKA